MFDWGLPEVQVLADGLAEPGAGALALEAGAQPLPSFGEEALQGAGSAAMEVDDGEAVNASVSSGLAAGVAAAGGEFC